MKTTLVKEIMVPLADYATVDENATMAEAGPGPGTGPGRSPVCSGQDPVAAGEKHPGHHRNRILRLSDVAETIFGMVKQCPVQAN
jgi:hypothetical protein